jgi:glycosyltransferase involved in cell wall biosynthesis
MRITLGIINARKAYREIGEEVNWVYERLAAFQTLGGIFKKNGKLWILETNAPLFVEAKSDRNAIVLNSLAKYLEIKAYQNCDILVCISDNLKEIIIEQADISPQKVIVVPNGVDISFFDPSLVKPIRFYENFTIGFVGNLASWQGVELLLDVVRDVREEGFNIYLVIVGEGSQRQELEEKVNQFNLEKYVKFTGFIPQENVPQYIAGFDIGYSGQTQRTETRMYCSPIKLYEYMAMGKPAIASDYEDTRRVIKDGNGYLFKIEDGRDLKRVIMNAYQNKNALSQMGRKARDEIIQNHSWDARVNKLIEEIKIILKA